MSGRPKVLASLENPYGDYCVDIFVRADGSFGFEEYRRDPDDGSWRSLHRYSGQVFKSSLRSMAAKRMKWVPALMLCAAGCAGTGDSSYRGMLTWGHEVRAFKPCGSAKSYWVVGEEKLLRPLRDRSERGKPYQPVYVEVVGAIDTQSARDGFAKDYDGIFRLREIKQVSNVVPEECGK